MSATITTITTRPCFLCGNSSTEEVTAEREKFITGTHPQCWEDMFGPEPE